MPKGNRLRAGSAKPEQMTYEQLDATARAIAFDLLGEKEEAVRLLLVIFAEIAAHPFDHSHVELAANLMRDHLFAVTPESDKAERECVAASREAWLKRITT